MGAFAHWIPAEDLRAVNKQIEEILIFANMMSVLKVQG
jgi:hypothetical protein